MGSATVGIRTGGCAGISERQLPSFEDLGFLKEVTSQPQFARGLRESIATGLPVQAWDSTHRGHGAGLGACMPSGGWS